ncbi:MAG TPA: M14 family zinc carboxypeptidase [Thermoanaerobaculales bacterium]|nr:M14 family zinc carboxypeptidase [Thermoanaerobaculales bacterium]HQL31030.1 M14 family zinc carboxypeptidase [Thermoanaerobaculales bacterium]HQN95472.1 M14 family zinc carboxypeptidase [Thermoanaerobaculales bacterium]HQP42199.1 M14 family zinc carboxypeptidase [Thermoanaerobaculales bacterium]
MRMRFLFAAAVVVGAALVAAPIIAAGFSLPDDHRTLTRTTSFAEMEAFLHSVEGADGVTLSIEGRSSAGRPLYVVHLTGAGERPWRILLYAQQHGDEVSGKDALLYLVRDIARDPGLLPADVDLWVMPMVNPDGAEANTREGSTGADLNRDHISLEQPETQALHRLARRLRPAVAVDCHEFGRDSESWLQRGWLKWPDITMDSLNNPLFDPAVRGAALRFLGTAADAEARADHPFLRYWVGGVPPDEEQRHSAPDIDGGLNALGMYGGQSYIIEAAAQHAVEGQRDRDLGNRVDAYLVLLRAILQGDGSRAEDLAAIEAARRRPLPAFLPTNYLWVNPDTEVTEFPVIEAATGSVLKVPTANLMTTMAVKRTVPTPRGYAITAPAAPQIRQLLERHGIPFEELAAARTFEAETCTLARVEEEFDELYSRYEGRQIVTRGAAAPVELPAGSLWVALEGEPALRAVLVLEPAQLYGLYQYPTYRALVGADGTLPVLRVVR